MRFSLWLASSSACFTMAANSWSTLATSSDVSSFGVGMPASGRDDAGSARLLLCAGSYVKCL